jgi:hypothetical protein
MISIKVNDTGEVTLLTLDAVITSTVYHIDTVNFHKFAINHFDAELATQAELDRVCKLWDNQLMFKYIAVPCIVPVYH